MTKPTFEDYQRKFDAFFKKAGPYDAEVIKRCLGFSSPALGKGKTKTKLKDSALKLLVNFFLREPMEAGQPIETEAPKTMEIEKKNSQKHDEEIESKDDTDKEYTVVQSLCKHYTRNRCKKGADCKYGHPKVCNVFSKYGPLRKSNPQGCAKDCGLFHMKEIWCQNAIKFGDCKWGNDCKYKHIKGTKMRKSKFQAKYSNGLEPRKDGMQQFKLTRNIVPTKPYSAATYAQVTSARKQGLVEQRQNHNSHTEPQTLHQQKTGPFLGQSMEGIFQILIGIDKRLQGLEGAKTNQMASLY